jgi:transposase
MAMQKRLTKKERFFNNINLTADDEVYVGIDVHKIKYHVAIWLNNGIALTFVTPSDNLAIAHTLGKLTPGLKQIVYEAGPTGFSLARMVEKTWYATSPAIVVSQCIDNSTSPTTRLARHLELQILKILQYPGSFCFQAWIWILFKESN